MGSLFLFTIFWDVNIPRESGGPDAEVEQKKCKRSKVKVYKEEKESGNV